MQRHPRLAALCMALVACHPRSRIESATGFEGPPAADLAATAEPASSGDGEDLATAEDTDEVHETAEPDAVEPAQPAQPLPEIQPPPPFVPPVAIVEDDAYLELPAGTKLYASASKEKPLFTIGNEPLFISRVGLTRNEKWQVLLSEGELEDLEYVELWLFVPAGVGNEHRAPTHATLRGLMGTPTQCCLAGTVDPDHRWQVEHGTLLFWNDGSPAGRVIPTLLFDVRGTAIEVEGRSLTCFALEPEKRQRRAMDLCVETSAVTQVSSDSVRSPFGNVYVSP